MTTMASQLETASAAERKSAAPILVATDGTASADGAFRAASLLARATGAPVHVLTALDPQPLIVPSAEMLAPPVDLSESFAMRRHDAVRGQLERLVGAGTTWPTEVKFGKPSAVIAEAARRHSAGLIVTGLNHHDLLQRLVAGDTPVQVARLADVPILAVPPEFMTLPKVVVVAVDLTRSSERAAAAARPLVREATTIHLVHVKPPVDLPVEVWRGWDREYEEAEREAFAAVARALELPADVTPVTTTLMGAPAREVLRFAESVGAELIVAGHSHRSFLDRVLGGSVSARVYRGARCAVLIVPDRTRLAAGRQEAIGRTESVRDPARWPEVFREFTYRNASRRVTLEVDDAELGAQAEARDYPFLGIDFDRKDGSIEIMLGDPGPDERHLTHVVRKPTSVDVLRGPDGKDKVLHIAREGGQTLVTLN